MYEPLSFDYEIFLGMPLLSAKGRCLNILNNGDVSYDEILLQFGSGSIRIEVDQDTDQLIISPYHGEIEGDWVGIPYLDRCLRKELGWCWVGKNYNNYTDLFVISFQGPEPELAFYGLASAVSLFQMETIKDHIAANTM